MHGYLESADLSGFDDDNEEESEWRLLRPLCSVLWTRARAAWVYTRVDGARTRVAWACARAAGTRARTRTRTRTLVSSRAWAGR